MSKKDTDDSKSKDKNKSSDDKKEKKPREKKVDYEGSRWGSLIVLFVTVVVSFFLYLTGNH
jgi:hypothetical protein